MPRDPSAHTMHSHGVGAYDRPPTHARRRSRDPVAGPSSDNGDAVPSLVDGDVSMTDSGPSNGYSGYTNGNGYGTGHGNGHGYGRRRYDSQRAFFERLDAMLATVDTVGTLEELDDILIQFVRKCGLYHDDYLRDPDDIARAVIMLLDSDLFEGSNQRMVGIMMAQAVDNTNPHELYIWYYLIHHYGQRNPSLFRSHRKWTKLLPTLMETVEVVPDDDGWVDGLPPIEYRLHLPATQLLYEVCRVMRLTESELDLFTDTFIDHLFDIVEQSRSDRDDVLGQAVVKLILALNEQFMVWSLPKHHKRPERVRASSSTNLSSQRDRSRERSREPPEADPDHLAVPPVRPSRPRAHSLAPVSLATTGSSKEERCEEGVVEETKRHNRVLVVLMRRLGSSKAFGEFMCFMLNRAEDVETPEGLGAQLIILKMLYLLFTTPGTQEYFYSNDLRVVIDVFIRMLIDLPEELNQLRHTMLRVLYPLLCNSQMKTDPYKRSQLCLVLNSLVANAHIRDVDPTTKRLVERCLSAAKENTVRANSEPAPVAPKPQRNLSPESAVSLGSLAHALPTPVAKHPLYTNGNPVRVTSLIDVSAGCALERPSSAASGVDSATDATDRSATSTPLATNRPLRRRKAPAPPKRKHSTASTVSSTSDEGDGGIPTGPPGLVDTGAGGVPPPIIEVARPEWVTFTA